LKQQRKSHSGIVTRLINKAALLLEGRKVERSIICLNNIDQQLTEKLKVLRGFNETFVNTD